MKQYSKLLTGNILVLIVIISSCHKETEQQFSTEPSSVNHSQGNQPDDPGFADNDMVIFWNEKAAEVLNPVFTQPPRTRVFARIQVAVHDALNAIKPKYETYAFHEREQHANPDAAVASAAYWILKQTTLSGNPPLDQWYAESLATIPDGESKESGKAVGKRSADALIANRANDGHSQIIVTSTTPANGTNPGEFRSTLTAIIGCLRKR